MFRTTVIFITVCLLCSVVQAQQSFAEKLVLPQPDCEQKAISGIKKITIVIPDDSNGVDEYAKWWESVFKSRDCEASIKTESMLQQEDLNGDLLILGPIGSFLQWGRFGMPLKKLEHGFSIGKYILTDIACGFSYASPPGTTPVRLAKIGNSFNAYKQVVNMPFFAFEFIVLNNAVPEFIGNGSLVDMNALKETLYTPKESKYYTFMISNNLSDEDTKEINDTEFDKYDIHAEAFVKRMELNLPEKKIKTYIHATQEEIKYFSGSFGGLCGGTTYGFVAGDEIHSWKMGGAIKHEANHHLFNQQINKMAATFLNEGIQKWYEYSISEEDKAKGFEKAIEIADYDLSEVICGKENFFQGDKYYLVSGIFTDYLIETYGLNKFKELYKYEALEILSGFEKTYNKPLSLVLEDYKKWLHIKPYNQNQ